MSEFGALKLQSNIEERIARLIESAENLIVERKDKLEQIDTMSSQIRNVMSVANDAPHVAVVTNFVRYQIGRAGVPRRAWKDTGLGEALIKEIEGKMHDLAKEAVTAAEFGDVGQVQAQLTRLLLGFMYRRYVYESERLRQGGRK
jgi:hypothetical protein